MKLVDPPPGLSRCEGVPVTGEQWGNFVQTYSMVGLISAALRLSKPWEDVI